MKIDLEECVEVFEELLGAKQAGKIFSFLKENLACTKCKKWKRDSEFSEAAKMTNRRGRFPICRKCDKLRYMKRKLKDFE